MISFAYLDDFNFKEATEAESIDCISSAVSEVILDNYPNLNRIRISKCHNLTKVHLSNMPKLQVVDILDNPLLVSVSFDNCPEIVTVDAGFCQSLKNLTGISSLKYLSAPCCYDLKLEPTPNVIYLDITGLEINPLQIVEQYHHLECLVCSCNLKLKLSDITKNHSLKVLQLESSQIICDSIDPQTNLKIIIFNENQEIKDCAEGNLNLLENFYVACQGETNKDLNNFTMFDDYTPEYRKYQKMLYGPWGVPKIDRLSPLRINKPIFSPPNNINHAKAADSIIGSIFASAVFDMIGVGVEFIPDKISKALLLGEMDITWSHPRCNEHNMRFVRGTPTDDTSQSILIMRSIVDTNINPSKSPSTIEVNGVKIDPCDFGHKLVKWIFHGHTEHKHDGGLGCGSTTFRVIQNPYFSADPIKASKEVWIETGKKIAPNGSVMRIASSGSFAFWDEQVVIKVAEYYARVTHADPRCIYSSITSALIIARYIQFNSGFITEEPNIDQILEETKKYVEDLGDYENDINYYNHCQKVEDLKLSEEGKIGYCLKAFGSAIWALRYCNSIEEAIVKVIREGGDSDTNGAVVGALLGAKFGFHAIPNELIKYMFIGQWMFREISPYMQLMGIEMPASPYV